MLLGLVLDIICKNMTIERSSFFDTRTRYFLTAGKGDGFLADVALDQAREVAGLGYVVRLSSIVGPNCQRVRRRRISPGSIVSGAFAQMICDEPGKQIACAVAVAHPTDPSRASLVMEHHGYMRAREAKKIVVQMARAGLLDRGLQVRRVESIAVEHVVGAIGAGATFAAVVEL